MYQRILVAIDGSVVSEQALAEAIRLAQALHSELCIVHAVDEIVYNWEAEYMLHAELVRAWVENGRALLKRAAATARSAGVGAQTRLIEIDTPGRRITEAIAHEADDWAAELIVIGSHGRRGLNRLFLGSVAEGIMRTATKPLLLVRGVGG